MTPKACSLVLATLLSLATALPTAGQPSPFLDLPGPQRVGEVVEARYATPHPYPAALDKRAGPVWTTEIVARGATYVSPHFSRFELAPGDSLIVRSPDGTRSWTYEGLGKKDLGRTGGFWGIHIAGERAILELYSRNRQPGFGFEIDRVAQGFAAGVPVQPEAICGVDDSDWAQCYQVSEASIYAESRAVARLLIQGASLCTGWLVGDEGHLITNNHCISTQQAADNTDFEFLAEGTCGQVCGQLACPGTVVTTSSTLVQTSSELDLDYTLVLLDTNPSATYGYMQLRETGPVVDERLYLPQHPRGEGKRIAVTSTDAHDASGFAEVANVQVFNFGGAVLRTTATYFADTDSGSSGSPVLGDSDHCVIALHFGALGCGSLGNGGTAVQDIIGDLGANLPHDALCPEGRIFTDGFESGNVSAWSSSAP